MEPQKVVTIKAGELLKALNEAKTPLHFVFKKKNGEIVDSTGTRNIEYLQRLNLRNSKGPVDLTKINNPLPSKTAFGGPSILSRYPYWDVPNSKWRSFDKFKIVGMTSQEQAQVVAQIAENYIDKNSLEAKNLIANTIEFIKLLSLADETAKKSNKKREDITIADVLNSDVTKDKNEARKIASAPRLHTQGSIKVKGALE